MTTVRGQDRRHDTSASVPLSITRGRWRRCPGARGACRPGRRPGAGCRRRRAAGTPSTRHRAGREDRAHPDQPEEPRRGRRRPRAPRPPAATVGGARRPRARRSASGRRPARTATGSRAEPSDGRRRARRCCGAGSAGCGPAHPPVPAAGRRRARRAAGRRWLPPRPPGPPATAPALAGLRQQAQHLRPDHGHVAGADGEHEVAGADEAGDRRGGLRTRTGRSGVCAAAADRGRRPARR